MDISKKLVETHSLTKEECLELFSLFNNLSLKYIFPLSGFPKKLIARNNVLLPEPDGPIITILSPLLISKLIFFNTLSLPKLLFIFSNLFYIILLFIFNADLRLNLLFCCVIFLQHHQFVQFKNS